MAQTQAWIPIEDCINDYLSESEQSIHKYFKCWQIAFRGMREMGLDIFWSIKSIKIPVNSNMTVDLPADFLQYQKVGVENAKGEIIALKYNEKLISYADVLTDRATKTEDNTLLFNSYYLPASATFYNYWNGADYTPLYGIPSGAPFVGSFKVDSENGVVLLDEHFKYSYIILEYVASPEVGGDYKIPVQFSEALISYIRWKDIISLPSSRRGNGGDKQQRRHEYFRDRYLAMNRYKPLRLLEAYEWNLESQRRAVKG